MKIEEARQLLNRYNSGQCTEEEKTFIERSFLSYNEHGIDISSIKIEDLGREVLSNLKKKTDRKSSLKLWITFSGAAAAIAVILWMYYPNNSETESFELAEQIVPAGNQAIVTLSSGKQISLSKTKSTLIVNPAHLSYDDGSTIDAGTLTGYQTIRTPKGGEYKIVLSDGTKVWLNAATVLQYPSTFREQVERRVKLVSGQAYFEVAKDKKHPFIVSSQNQDVTVLGTKFDINTYSNNVKTTLLEGSVRLNFNFNKKANMASLILNPGDQSVNENDMFTKTSTDTSLAVAWKNGRIKFRNAELSSILSEAERWYSIDVKYNGEIPDIQLTGGISRKSNLATLLKLLKLSGIKFKVDNRSGRNTLTIESL